MYIENHAFGTCRTTKNKKNARSAGAERVKTKKIAVRHLPTTSFSKLFTIKILFYGTKIY